MKLTKLHQIKGEERSSVGHLSSSPPLLLLLLLSPPPPLSSDLIRMGIWSIICLLLFLDEIECIERMFGYEINVESIEALFNGF